MSQRVSFRRVAASLVVLGLCTTIGSGCRSTDTTAAVPDTVDEASVAELPDQDATALQPQPRWKIPDGGAGIGPLSDLVVPVSAERGETESRVETPQEPLSLQTSYEPAMRRAVEHIRAEEFDETVLTSDVPVLVDFYMDGCGPCNTLAPILDELARETPDVRVVKVNATHSKKFSRTYGVRRFPTVMVFKEGRPVSQHVGLLDRKALEQLLER